MAAKKLSVILTLILCVSSESLVFAQLTPGGGGSGGPVFSSELSAQTLAYMDEVTKIQSYKVSQVFKKKLNLSDVQAGDLQKAIEILQKQAPRVMQTTQSLGSHQAGEAYIHEMNKLARLALRKILTPAQYDLFLSGAMMKSEKKVERR